jgi:pimeloyl-ACP methyl ester carboxylesterase
MEAAFIGTRLAPVLKECRASVADGRRSDAVITFLSAVGRPDPSLPQIAKFLEDGADGMIEDLECITSMTSGLPRWTPGDVPILLLTGSESGPHYQESAALLQRDLPLEDTVTLPGQGHAPSDPELVAERLDAFFSRH